MSWNENEYKMSWAAARGEFEEKWHVSLEVLDLFCIEHK
jgi:hypothetical protein